MKIFVSGIAGFLGSHIAERCIMEGHEVSGVDNLIGGDKENVPAKVKFTVADCNDLSKMTELMKDVDVVYHCACTAYEGLSVFSPKIITDNTFGITVSVVTAAIKNKVKRFIFCSSMARYGDLVAPFTEDMECKPQDPYGIAKYASELVIRNLCDFHGMEYVIVVPHNIIGPRQKYDDPYRNVASIMINRMLQGKQPIIYGDGNQMRCFSFIDDVVNPMFLLASSRISGHVINVGPDDGFITINYLAQTIADDLDFTLEPIYYPARPREVKLANCSANKARLMLDYKAEKIFEDGIHDMIEYIKEKGTKPFDYKIGLELITPKIPQTWVQKII